MLQLPKTRASEDCSELHVEVGAYLTQQAMSAGRGRGQGRGRGRGGPAVNAISMSAVQSMVDSLFELWFIFSI